jgi:hypothetical protein
MGWGLMGFSSGVGCGCSWGAGSGFFTMASKAMRLASIRIWLWHSAFPFGKIRTSIFQPRILGVAFLL